ncbi:MAG: PEGA domain-containing protein [Planctomycetes bacterium]|nr:PEGA domain-containing protein [Planctomycetota bacterium]
MKIAKRVLFSSAVWAGGAALWGGGCANTKVAEVLSNPSGASIFVDGEKRGTTPAKVQIDFGSDPTRRVLIQVCKHRYQPGFQYWTSEDMEEKKKFELGVD